MKKTILLSLLILLFFSFANSFVFAQGSCDYKTQCSNGQRVESCCPKPYNNGEGGLVPCGTTCCPCTLCDVFVLINNIVHLLLFRIIPIVAALLIAIGGIMLIWAYAGSGGPAMLVKAKSLFTSVIIGLLIIYCAWLIVNVFFMAIGVNKWEGFENGWWKIECGSSSAPASSSDTKSSDSQPGYGEFQGGKGGEFKGNGASGTW